MTRRLCIGLTVLAWLIWLVPPCANFGRVNAIYQSRCLDTDLNIICASGTIQVTATHDPSDSIESIELQQYVPHENIIYDGDALGVAFFPDSRRLTFWRWHYRSQPGLLLVTIPWIVLAIFPGWITFLLIRKMHRIKPESP